VGSSTRLQKAASRARFERYRVESREDQVTPDAISIAGFVLWRLRHGVSAATVKADITTIAEDWPEAGRSALVKKALRAADRIADVPDEAKDPLSLPDLRQLRQAIKKLESKLTGDEVAHLRVRDWTAYLLGFVGMLRGGEFVALLWDHLRFRWRNGISECESTVDQVPHNVQLVSLVIHVVQSKPDWKGVGAQVQITAREGARLSDCPVRLLLHLWSLRRPAQQHVFAEVRALKPVKGLSTDTLRSRLKTYLSSFMPEEQVRRLSLHSLRRGGATAAAAHQIPVRLIKHQGRWKSDAVFLYTLTADQEALRVSDTVLNALNLLYE
jgi:integrase